MYFRFWGLRHVFFYIIANVTKVSKVRAENSSSKTCLTTTGTHVPYGITHLLAVPRQRWHSRLYPLVLNFTTSERSKAEFTYSCLRYITRLYTRPKTLTHPSTNRAQRRVTSFMRRTTLPLRQHYGPNTTDVPTKFCSTINANKHSSRVAQRGRSLQCTIFGIFNCNLQPDVFHFRVKPNYHDVTWRLHRGRSWTMSHRCTWLTDRRVTWSHRCLRRQIDLCGLWSQVSHTDSDRQTDTPIVAAAETDALTRRRCTDTARSLYKA